MDKTRIFEAAGRLAAKGQLDKAAREYQRILDEDPKDVRALQKLAEIWQKSNKARESADLLLRVAETYSEQGFFLKAVAVYKQILKLVPDRIEVNQRLAQLYQQLGLVGDATQQYQVVVNHFDKLGDMHESLAALRKMVELDPDNIASQVKLGELYARERMIPEALSELRKASGYLKRNNRFDDYIRVLERMGQLAPEDPIVAKEVAQGFLGQGDPRRALARLQICFRHNPKDVETLDLLARAFAALGQQGKTVSVYRELANVHAERNNADAERETLGQIIELAPGDPDAIARLKQLASRHAAPAVIAVAPSPGQMPVAAPERPAFSAPPPVRPRKFAANISPALARLLTETDVYLKYGLIPKAAEHIKKAILEDPNSIDVREKLVAVLERQGKSEEAIQEIARIVELARAAGDSDRESIFTQDLAQRAPDHPLVRAAAELAALPAATDDEIIIEPDDIEVSAAAILAADVDLTPPSEQEAAAAEAAEVADSLWDASAEESEEEEVFVDAEVVEGEDEPANEPSVAPGNDVLMEAISRVARPPVAVEPLDPFKEVSSASAVDEPAPPRERTPQWAAAPSRPGVPEKREITSRSISALARPRTVPPPEIPADRFAQQCSEADFLIQQGLIEDARHLLETILAQAPEHARAAMLLSRIQEVSRKQPREEEPEEEYVPVAPSSSGGFDLGKELAAELEDLEIPMAGGSAPSSISDGRQRIAAVSGSEDSQGHYDLGIAYKEMGKFEKAIREFETALESSGRRRVVDCLIMIGVCRLELSDPQAAMPHFEQALQTPGLTLEASKETHFEIARCHEMLGAERPALDHFARVYKADPNYRDVKARILRLKQLLNTGGPDALRASGTDGPISLPPTPPLPSPAAGHRAPRGKVSYI